ncbi:MAG: hypothetical protein AAF927_32920, partial [Bacteroidota bacterium]
VWLIDTLGHPLNGELLASGKQPVLLAQEDNTLYRGQFRSDTLYFPAGIAGELLLATPEGSLAYVDAEAWVSVAVKKSIQFKRESSDLREEKSPLE